ncbi:LIM-domain binding protein-domain-containing protein [Ganoderma leucocontextum]|nr:LIM-domain binding protein-domain-containing protein [Ganoderma leucocontextum]
MTQQLFPQQPQHGQQPNQHQHNLGLLQNNQGANPGLGIIAGQPGPSTPNYPMNMQPGNPQRRPVFMSTQPNGSGLHPGGGGGPPHMAGLAPSQMQGLQNMGGSMGGFPGAGMIPQQTIRRVQSQPLGQAGAHAHMGGMQPGMIGGGMPGMPGPPQMGGMRMNPNIQMRPQPQQHGQGGGAMSPEMGLPMGRPGPMAGVSQLQPHTRTGSGSQLMPTLTQPANLGQGHAMQHNFGGPMSLSHQHQSSQMGSTHIGPSGQQPPNMGPQPGGNRAQMVTPDNTMFMNFQNTPIQPPLSHGVPRMPLDNMSNPQFNIAHSPSPMHAGGDMSQRGNAPMNASGPMTPAQVLNMNAGGDSFPANSYGMGQPPISAPPRPPSHNGPHNGFPMPSSQSQPSLAPQRSPRQPDHLSNPMHPGAGTMQRPQSQPQVAHRSSPIPSSGRVRTPRGSQPSLPMNASGMLPPARVPTAIGQSPQGPSHPSAQPLTSAPPSAHPAQIAPRPRSATPAAPSAPTRSTSTAPPAGQQSTAAESSQPPRGSAPPSAPAPGPSAPAPVVQPTPAQIPRNPIYPVGLGQGINRLLQLSYHLGVESKDRLNMSYWTNFVAMYFTEKSTIKLTLWKDNQQAEAKPFEIGYPIFPRFFLVTSQSGVKTQTLVLDGARERCINPMHGIVECPAAQWTFRYTNGYCITLRGPLTAEIVVLPLPMTQTSSQQQLPQYILKLDRLVFDAMTHEKYLAFDAIHGNRLPDSPQVVPMSPGGAVNPIGTVDDPNKFEEPRYMFENVMIPQEPINAFGIPQATMRCLELAESVTQMTDLIQFSITRKLGPCDALKAFAQKLREEHRGNYNGNLLISVNPGYSEIPHGPGGAATSGPSTSFGNMGIMPGPSQPPPSGDQPSTSQPDGVPKSAKAAPPQSAQASGSTPSASTPASAPTPGGAPTTPSIANTSLKRKQPPSQRTGDDSPTTANANTEQQPAKRANRKRGRTQGS